MRRVKTTILYIILIVVILFGAMPFNITQEILNALVDGVNVIMQLITGIVNGIIQLLLGIVYGIINFVIGGLYNILALYLPLDAWVNLVPQSVMWTWYISHVNFAAAGFNVALSPIGMFINTIVNDPLISNVIGGLAFGALAILLIIIALKTRKK